MWNIITCALIAVIAMRTHVIIFHIADYTIPESVKEILPGAFEGCEKIKKVVFAKTVDKIGAKAFASMTALEEIVLPPDYPVLGDGLFMGCANLKFIT